MIYYTIFGVLVIILSVAFNIIYNLYYIKKINNLGLRKDFIKCIKENEKLLLEVRGEYLKNIIRFNMGIGLHF